MNTKIATEVWNFETNQIIYSPICSSVYEDAPLNYLIDYAFVDARSKQDRACRLLGLDAAGKRVFWYKYPTMFCNTAFNSRIIHLENTKFPAVGPRVLNLSTRGTVSTGDNVLINGFIITGTDPKTVVLRALGPSLGGFGISGVLADPVLSVYNSSGTLIATNDNWQTDIGATFMEQYGLAPSNPAESATLQTNLAPGAYTMVVTGKNITQGIAWPRFTNFSAAGLTLNWRTSAGAVLSARAIMCSLVDSLLETWEAGPSSCAPLAHRWVPLGKPTAERSHADNLRFEGICYRNQR